MDKKQQIERRANKLYKSRQSSDEGLENEVMELYASLVYTCANEEPVVVWPNCAVIL